MGSDLLVVGLSYRTAPLEVRERLAFPEDALAPALRELGGLPSIGEAVLLSTCNRVEVFAATRASVPEAVGEVARFLSGRKIERLETYLYNHSGPDAVKHVFRVASSLDSLVLGEPQILGQLKTAYGAASEAGCVGPFLGRCLERAFRVAKRVRSETAIARGAANISSVAVDLAKRVFGELAGKIVLVIGAGKMSALAARHLRADGAEDILVVNRSPGRAEELARRIGGAARPWSELDSLLTAADVVISSTGAPQPIITRALMKPVVKARRHRPLFICDIAVPRDVEPAAGKLDGIYLFDIDDLEKVAADNRKERGKEAASAEEIVEGEVRQFVSWQRSQGVVPTIKDLRERFRAVAAAEVERTLAGLRLDERGAQAVRQLADSIVGKLLHAPLTALKQAGDEAEHDFVAAARRLFALGEPAAEAVQPVDEPRKHTRS